MTLKRMSEFKRDDYTYESPDGDQWEITIVQTADRKYIEIKKGEDDAVQWDVEMLLDIADAVRTAIQKPVKTKPHKLKKPSIVDHRKKEEIQSPSETIQASVDESLDTIGSDTVPVVSFSPDKRDLLEELEKRKEMAPGIPDPEKVIKRRGRNGV